ncbi:MAG: Holliday junction resolvase RuvX [Elainellaceae cyanobacterium]
MATTTILGLDPGREKCGVAVVQVGHDSAQAATEPEFAVLHHDVVSAELALSAIAALILRFDVSHLVLGNQTTSAAWYAKLEETVKIPMSLVDERNSTLEARDRYWVMYPASGLARWVPQALRGIPGPVDGIVAILLIERHLAKQEV